MRQKKLLFAGFILAATFCYSQNDTTRWSTDGNSIDTASFIGTTNSRPIKFRANNVERFRIMPNGKVGIGTKNPQARLDVNGNTILRANVRLTGTELILADSLQDNHNLLFSKPNGLIQKVKFSDFQSKMVQMVYAPPFPNQPLTICDLPGYLNNPHWQNGFEKIYTPCPEVNVGIGTDAPIAKLDVRGRGYFESGLNIGDLYTPSTQAFIEGYGAFGDVKPWLRMTVDDSGDKETVFLLRNDGGIYCTSARVRVREDIPVPDFVFRKDYELMPLSEVKAYVTEHSHLPEIPSEQEIRDDGLSLEEMQLKLLQKVEELTLYLFELKEENEQLKADIQSLKNK